MIRAVGERKKKYVAVQQGAARLRIRGPTREIQEFLSHATIETTMRYTAVDRDELRRVVERAHPRGKLKVPGTTKA